MPGLYNLRLYAARGYVVLVPSMPLPPDAERRDVYAAVGNGVFPAVDALVASGIADPDRLGVFGQSYGGYSVYALVTQTNRFKAAVAMAGITDLAGMIGQFDPLARGYPGIAHEKGSNWFIADQFGQHRPPLGAALDDYRRNSPLSYSDRVATPLLMLHGEDDDRGSKAQAEQFFYALYSQGKTSRLVTYGGESHSVAQSPANIGDAFNETVSWFDHYVRDAAKGAR
jgi:dipeptidyl aminopeptidase/acylaminoacyl peptidase